MKYIILAFILPYSAFAYTAKDYDKCMSRVEKIRNTKARDISNADYGVMLKGCNYMLPKFEDTSPIEAAPTVSPLELQIMDENRAVLRQQMADTDARLAVMRAQQAETAHQLYGN